MNGHEESGNPQTGLEPVEARAAGIIGSPDQTAQMTSGRFDGGPADGLRFIDVAPSGGMHLRILPDRGFDIGPAWHRGQPVAWLSKVGPAPPLDQPAGMAWRDRFGGGLLTTCGLDNVGAPSEGVGLHGTVSHLRADDVVLERVDGDVDVRLVARARLHDVTALGRHLEMQRTITTRTGSSTVEVHDTVINRGSATEPAPVLYHVNLGYPFWQPGAGLEIASERVEARDEIGRSSAADGSWAAAPAAVAGAEELVYEHHGLGAGAASLVSPALGSRVDVSWDRETLPRLYQWTHPAEGVYVVGIEPSNASALGRADDRAAGTLPVIEPGEARHTGVTIAVHDSTEAPTGS